MCADGVARLRRRLDVSPRVFAMRYNGCSMEMAYRDRWRAEIAELQRILSGFELREECKWGKPCYTLDGNNVVLIQGFKAYCALCFFQGALLKDPKKLLVQLGQTRAAR